MATIISSCTDRVDLDQLTGNSSRLVVYAFPTEGDTIEITVTQTYPMNRRMPPLNIKSVSCATNNASDRIVNCGDTTDNGMTIARFLAIGSHQCGDSITIAVKAKNLPDVYGGTVIPQKPTIESARLDTASYKGENYPVVRLAMRDNPSTKYYAVRIEGMRVNNYDDSENEYLGNNKYNISTDFAPLNAGAEPLLNNTSNTEFDFGDWNADFYRNIYNFSNTTFADGSATLHLYVDVWSSYDFCNYRPHLLALSTEYSSMLHSLNDITNNDLGKYSLAFAYSTYTNVHGGYGCIGAYAKTVGEWIKKM